MGRVGRGAEAGVGRRSGSRGRKEGRRKTRRRREQEKKETEQASSTSRRHGIHNAALKGSLRQCRPARHRRRRPGPRSRPRRAGYRHRLTPLLLPRRRRRRRRLVRRPRARAPPRTRRLTLHRELARELAPPAHMAVPAVLAVVLVLAVVSMVVVCVCMCRRRSRRRAHRRRRVPAAIRRDLHPRLHGTRRQIRIQRDTRRTRLALRRIMVPTRQQRQPPRPVVLRVLIMIPQPIHSLIPPLARRQLAAKRSQPPL